MRCHQIKKIVLWLITSATISLCSISPVSAQDEASGGGGDANYLAQIAQFTSQTAQYTNVVMQSVNSLPTVLADLGQFLLAWMSPDDSTTTATLQQSFTNLGNLLNQDLTQQLSTQQQLNTLLITPSGQGAALSASALPFANDLMYSSVLGNLYFSPDPRGKNATPALNYIKNASGINLPHTPPMQSWNGKASDQLGYINYYMTVMAVESFNGYILSNQYIDNNQFNTLQQTLITQASDPKNWFAQVASENIGFVLRQILLYESQTFILFTQLIQTQKQMVTAQAMTNALLIANNQMNEGVMLGKAQGQTPQ